MKIKKIIGATILTWSQLTGGKSYEIASKLNAEIYNSWKNAADDYLKNPTQENLNHLKIIEYHAKKYAVDKVTHRRGKEYLKRLMKWTMNIN